MSYVILKANSMLRKNVKEMFKSKTKATFDGVDNFKVKVRKL